MERRKFKILILMSGGFDTYGPSRHLYDALIEDILKDGHTVHLIESHSSGVDPDVPEKYKVYSSFSYETINTKVVKKKNFAKRYIVGAKYSLKTKKYLKANYGKFDLVFVQSCPWAPILLPIVKKRLKIPLIWNIQDMFPGSSIANGVMKRRWMQRFFYKFEKRAYKTADYITVISDDMKNKVIEQGVDPSKITVISDWFDDSTVSEIPLKDNLFVKKYNLDTDKFYVQYAGTMGFNFNYRVVCDIAEKLIDHKNIVFHMIGFGSQMDDFKKEVEKRNLTNVIFLPLEPQNMVSHVYSACSVCLIPLPKGVIGNSVPSKAGLLMACKRPIITLADEGSCYNKMINDNKIGYAFSDNDSEGAAEAIEFLSNNRDVAAEFGVNGFKFGFDLYSRTNNTNKYIDLFASIAKK